MVKALFSDPPGGNHPGSIRDYTGVLRPCAAALALALGLAIALGIYRVMSQFSAANAPIELLWPFLRPLGAIAVETAFLVGVPVGLAAAAFRVLPRGSGVRLAGVYLAFVRVALPVAFGLSALSVVASLAVDPGTSRPGLLAAELVEQARRGCLAPGAPKEIEVPLVRVRWLCADKAPRVTGVAPIGRSSAFSAAEIKLNEDLTRIRFRDLTLEAGATPQLKIRAAAATISGLRPWGRPQKMAPLVRGTILALCALGASLLIALLVIAMDARWRVEPWLTACLVGAALWISLSTLDRGDQGVLAYGLLPLAGLIAALCAGLLSHGAKRAARRWLPGAG